jgi:Ca2+-binding EF-hand superfamily protein
MFFFLLLQRKSEIFKADLTRQKNSELESYRNTNIRRMSASDKVYELLGDERIAELKEVFSTFDTKGENKIASDKVRNVFQAVGYDLPDTAVQSLLKEMTDNPELVTFDEVCTMVSKHAADFDQMASTGLLFNLLDKERKGYVNAEDICKFLGMIDVEISMENASKLVTSTSLFGYEQFNVLDMHTALMKN